MNYNDTDLDCNDVQLFFLLFSDVDYFRTVHKCMHMCVCMHFFECNMVHVLYKYPDFIKQ